MQSGLNPYGSRAPYTRFSSMIVKENAPDRPGSTARMAARMSPVFALAMWAVTRSVSEEEGSRAASGVGSPPASASVCLSLSELTRFPLWARATCPAEDALNDGCAFSHVVDPVVE
jgi:hypothetical protein